MSRDLSELAAILKDLEPVEIEKLLQELLTTGEQEALHLRWELIKMLSHGETQRAVAKKLGVSLCKVTRGNRILKMNNSVSRKIMEQLKNE